MKLSWGYIISSLYSTVAASSVGHVYVYDPIAAKAAPQHPPSVSSETARLILAQRLGLSRFHSIKEPSDELIDQLNTYGGRPLELFNGVRERSYAHALVWVEDVEDVKAIIPDSSAFSTEFTIANPPASSDNDRLIKDMILQAESLPKKSDPLGWTYAACIEAEVALGPIKKADTYRDFLTVLRADKSDKNSFAKLSQALNNFLQKAKAGEERGWSVTVVVMPPSSSQKKRSAQPYGTYDLPSSVGAAREQPEAPLSISSSQPSNGPGKSNISDLEDFPVITSSTDDEPPVDNSPVLGILPRCFESKEVCQKETHNCSGHGSCEYPGKADEGKGKACYQCMCQPTKVRVGDDNGMETKHKVTYWGGPACQKKDISMPFWLFVGIGVILAGLISASIGMLYSMGSEELPSVIGAGVSGPVRK